MTAKTNYLLALSLTMLGCPDRGASTADTDGDETSTGDGDGDGDGDPAADGDGDGDGEAGSGPGDGDGDGTSSETSTGDGDGDGAGDGDGQPGDGDGDPGDGDGDPLPEQLCWAPPSQAYIEPGPACAEGYEHACFVGEFDVDDAFLLGCCDAEFSCYVVTYPGPCAPGHIAVCEIS